MNEHARHLRAFLEARCAAMEARRRPLSWKAWVASMAVLAGCGGRTDPFQGVTAPSDAGADHDGAPVEDCENETDDDGDGLVDCEDSECTASAVCGARYGIPYDGG